MQNRAQHTSKPSLMKDSPFVRIGETKPKWLRICTIETDPEYSVTEEFRNIARSSSVQKISDTFDKNKPEEYRCTTRVRDLEGPGRRPGVRSTEAKRRSLLGIHASSESKQDVCLQARARMAQFMPATPHLLWVARCAADPACARPMFRTQRLGERIISGERRGGARPKDDAEYNAMFETK